MTCIPSDGSQPHRAEREDILGVGSGLWGMGTELRALGGDGDLSQEDGGRHENWLLEARGFSSINLVHWPT